MQQYRTSAARWSAILVGLSAGGAITALLINAAVAQMAHQHRGAQCTDPGLACASTVTPAFGPDGSLWIAWAAGGRVSVARSRDLGRRFAPAVAINREPVRLDSGPDERPKLAIDESGRIAVAYAIFKAPSTGRSFTRFRRMTVGPLHRRARSPAIRTVSASR